MEESPIIIHQKIATKRKARKRWQLTRAPQDKQYYNKLAKELKHLLRTHKNESIQNYLQELTPTAATDYSLWRAARKLKHHQHHIPPLRVNNTNWARPDKQKATAFAKLGTTGQAKSHGFRQTSRYSLYTVSITPIAHGRRKIITNTLDAPHQMTPPMAKIRIHEVKHVINTKSTPKRPLAMT